MISRKPLSLSRSLLLLLAIGMAASCAGPTPTPSYTATPILTPAATPIPSPMPIPAPVSQAVDEQGGTITLADGTKLMVPTGAVEGGGEITIEPVEVVEDEFVGLLIAGPIYRVTLEDAELVAPVQISIPLPEGVTPEEFEIAIYHYDEDQPAFVDPDLDLEVPLTWMPLPSTVSGGYVSAWVDSFSKFSYGWILKNASASASVVVDEVYTIGEKLTASLNGLYCTGGVNIQGKRYRYGDPIRARAYLMFDAPLWPTVLDLEVETLEVSDDADVEDCRPLSFDFEASLEEEIDPSSDLIYPKITTTEIRVYVEIKFNDDTLGIPTGKYVSDKYTVRIADRSRLVLVPPSAAPGGPFTIEGEGFEAGEDVDLTWDLETKAGPEIATAAVDDEERFRESIQVPLDAPPYTSAEIIARGCESGRVAIAELRVLESETPVTPEDGELSLAITPSRGKQGEVFKLSVSGLEPESTATVGLIAPGSTAEEILDDAVEADSEGHAGFSIGSHFQMAPGVYTVYVISNVGENARVEGDFELLDGDPRECLTLTPVGGDAARSIVLPRSIEEPVVVQFEVEDRCGRADPAEWMLVNYLGDIATLTLHEGPLLTVELHPGAYEPGTYNGAVGIHYPGRAFPTLVGLQVSVTDLSYVLPYAWTETSQVIYRSGRNGTVDENCVCTRSDVTSGQAADRFVTKQVDETCPSGCEWYEDSFVTAIDRLSGLVKTTTCTDCFQGYLGPQYNAEVDERVSVAGREVEIVSREWPVYEMSPAGDGEGYWEWEGRVTAQYDAATGVCVGYNTDLRAFYTGSGKTHYDYGDWSTTEQTIVETTFPYGGMPSPGEEPEVEECTTQRIPDVVGLPLSEAGNLLSSLGYGFTWEQEHYGEDQVGLIIRQEPAADTCASPRSTVVILYRNLGP